jgi:hypothetical protein
MLLQLPVDFGGERPCIVAIPVNGSSSLYRDVLDFGHWGLRRGCAVVYTDKGAGTGVRHPARVGREKLYRLRRVPPAVQDIAGKAQSRLCARYWSLSARGKRLTVGVTAP